MPPKEACALVGMIEISPVLKFTESHVGEIDGEELIEYVRAPQLIEPF